MTPDQAVSDPRVFALVAACPHGGPIRGRSLPIEEGGRGCGCQRYACAAGKGAEPGKVASSDCVACAAATIGRD